MKDFNYSNVLEEYINALPLASYASKYGFLLGHTAQVYSFIDHTSRILKEALKEGDLLKIKNEVARAESFLNALLVVGNVNDNKNTL